MSYPNQNPYGPPPGQQPGYGGYPQQQLAPYAPYPGGGMPGAPILNGMPGGVKAARVMLFVLAATGLLGIIGSVVGLSQLTSASSKYDTDTSGIQAAMNIGKGFVIVVIVLMAIYAAVAVVLATQFSKGTNSVRVGTIVFASVSIVCSLVFTIYGIVNLTLSILILVFVAKADGNAWFNRQRGY